MAVLANRVKETISSTGAGTLNLGGAVTGYQSFADAGVSNGNTVAYVIEDDSAWEIGTGTYTTGTPNTLSRTLGESSTGSLISVTTNAIVFITARAEDIQQPPSEGAFVDGDKTKLDGIEAGADVTDTTNVTAAGALMDSEVTDLAGIKGLDTTDILFADVADTLTAGYRHTPHDIGTVSTGTITPDPDDGHVQTVEVTGAVTIAPDTSAGDYALRLILTNGTGAGTKTISGTFDNEWGDAFTNTVSDVFFCTILKDDGKYTIIVDQSA